MTALYPLPTGRELRTSKPPRGAQRATDDPSSGRFDEKKILEKRRTALEENDLLISIVVPVYGTEAYLPACIESLCNQTYQNIQIILVDDQSPDNCPAICDEYAKKDSRITVIHQKNKGVSGARNTGMLHAKGDYLMFVDSDDELCPSAVDVLLKDAIEYGADVVSALKIAVDRDGTRKSVGSDSDVSVYRGEEPLLLSLNGDKNTNSVCAKLWKMPFVRDHVFDEGENIHEDGFFVFRCYMEKPILVQHNEGVYLYNFVENSGSKQGFSEKFFSMLRFCERKKELVAQYCPQYTEQAYNMEVRTHLQFLDVLCRTNDKKYKDTHKESAKIVRKLYRYHKPINDHHKKLAWIVAHGLYPLYKALVRLKYHR